MLGQLDRIIAQRPRTVAALALCAGLLAGGCAGITAAWFLVRAAASQAVDYMPVAMTPELADRLDRLASDRSAGAVTRADLEAAEARIGARLDCMQDELARPEAGGWVC